jgi:nitrite reductase/ring-hydroxylating ferredoxin subunit
MSIDHGAVFQLAVETYERDLGLYRSIEYKDVVVARAADIPEGERKIVQVDGLSIGVFHQQGNWYALRNSCLHRSGPVATGSLEGDILTCPWHGYQYYVSNGQLLTDPSAHLDMYPVVVTDGDVTLRIPVMIMGSPPVSLNQAPPAPAEQQTLGENEFRAGDLKPGQAQLVTLNGEGVAVYNVDGRFYATQDACTHADGPLSEGDLDGTTVVCPWHGSCFDVTDGRVTCGPATRPVKTFRVVVEGEIGHVE